MAPNVFDDHVLVLPEDKADASIANGFCLELPHYRRIQVLPAYDGWPHLLSAFRELEIPKLEIYPRRRLVVVVDFDGNPTSRMNEFKTAVPRHLKDRAFIVGCEPEPEALRNELRDAGHLSPNRWETIGRLLAADCRDGSDTFWSHPRLGPSQQDLPRLREDVRPFLF